VLGRSPQGMDDPIRAESREVDPIAQAMAAAGLVDPPAIQAYLDATPYSAEEVYRSPASVLRDRLAHCFDGAVFAAAALRRLGHPAKILAMLAVRDDDHILALYRRFGRWGAIAQSNFSGLRFREPVYRSLRELVMSYFELYFNAAGEKSLRAYTAPLDLASFDRLDWTRNDAAMDAIAQRLDEIRRFPILTDEMVAGLSPVDPRSLEAGLLGANPAGLYKL
jgi:hypothetical protein